MRVVDGMEAIVDCVVSVVVMVSAIAIAVLAASGIAPEPEQSGAWALIVSLLAWSDVIDAKRSTRDLGRRLEHIERVSGMLCDERAAEAYRIAHRERRPR